TSSPAASSRSTERSTRAREAPTYVRYRVDLPVETASRRTTASDSSPLKAGIVLYCTALSSRETADTSTQQAPTSLDQPSRRQLFFNVLGERITISTGRTPCERSRFTQLVTVRRWSASSLYQSVSTFGPCTELLSVGQPENMLVAAAICSVLRQFTF